MSGKSNNEDFFCLAPWNYLLIAPNMDVYTCYEGKFPMGNLSSSSLSEIWSGEVFKKLRREMMAGECPEHCYKCQKREEILPDESLRGIVNRYLGGKESLETYEEQETRILDISFSNKCNLKCRMCSPYYSNLIASEKNLDAKETRLSEEVWQEICQKSLSAKKIVMAGGEPLLDPRHGEFLDFLLTQKKNDVFLQYNTNGTVYNEKIKNLWREFSNVTISVSLDGAGKHASIIRSGSDFKKIEKNIEAIRLNHPHFEVKSYSTISAMNIYHLPEYLKEVLSKGIFSPTEIQMHYLVTPEEMSIQILPENEKREVEKQYNKFIKSFLMLEYDLKDVEKLIVQLKMILSYMFDEDRSALLPKFFSSMEELDHVRKESLMDIDDDLRRLKNIVEKM